MGNTESSCYSSLVISENISANVWAGTADGYVIGSYTAQDRLGGARHDDFLEETLPVTLNDMASMCA
jgi:hypothetical protein